MKLSKGTKLCGFTVDRVRDAKELNAVFVEMSHDKTGAELCFVDNKEENKLFAVSFKTLPEDSTGVFHILEHSVLCGSEKYPVKEPFVDLLKSSMNTFLNAMTYSDKTVYPVSSRNKKDFLNLTSVYLDAVFAPALKSDPNIFYQEGIHTELNGGVPSYKGVVFNEMKGAMSGVDDRIEQGISKLLFPDNCYRFNSGGDPAVIPDLNYEKYVKAYDRFYCPQNARFFLDGDVPLEETLDMINGYLEKADNKNAEKFEIPLQRPVTSEGTAYYEISPEEDAENSAVLAMGKIVGTWEEREKILAAHILCDVLADSNESPLKRAVLSSGLAEDFEMGVMDGIKQPYLIAIARNISDGNSGKITEIVRDTAKKLVSDGLDKKSVEASINRYAFSSKQISEPQGLYRALAAHTSWLYGGDPLLPLLYDDAIASLRKMAEGDGFERLLEELLSENDGLAVLHMLPSETLGEEERKAEDERVRSEISKLSGKGISDLEELNEKLSVWQQTPDTPEQTAAVPVLSLDEVNTEPEFTPTEVKEKNGVTYLYHKVPSHGIVYLSAYFPLTLFSSEELTKISLVTSFFGELPTKKRGAAELQRIIKTYIGNIGFALRTLGKDGDREKCTPCFVVRAGVLEENLGEAKKIIAEIITETLFDDTDKIKEIVLQTDEMLRQSAVGNGNALGVTAVQSHYSARAAVNEAVSGYTCLKFLHAFAKDFEGNSADFISLAKKFQTEAIGRNRLTVSVTAAENISFEDFAELLPLGTDRPASAAYKSSLPEKMGIKIPAQIGFAVKGYHLSLTDSEMSGSLRVLSNIVTLSYLWNVVRVQGGAYGAGFPVGRDGHFVFYSYRDPSPSRSVAVYDSVPDFIRDFAESKEDLDKYIISAVSAADPLQGPAEKGLAADEMWFAGVSDADRLKVRREMLETDIPSLEKWISPLEKAAEDGAVCIVGNEAVLKDFDGLTVFEL